MAHPAELALTEYMKKASAGESTISDATVANIANASLVGSLNARVLNCVCLT